MKWLPTDEVMLKSNLAKNMRYLRLSRNPHLSQTMLAQKLGTTQKSISKYERAHCLPPLHVLVSLADYFGLTLEELLYRNCARKRKDGTDQ